MKLEKIIGIVLILPPIISVVLFLLELFFGGDGSITGMDKLSSSWTGEFYELHTSKIKYEVHQGGGGYTSAAPIYLGLMAIAGSILLKNSSDSAN